MKALVLKSNAKLVVENIEKPRLGRDECLLRVSHAGICSSDIARAFHRGAYHYPLIMGHEFSGTIEAVGNSVKRFKKGDRVAAFPLIPCQKCEFCDREQYAQCAHYDYYGSRRDGAFCEYIAVKEWNLFPLPNNIRLADASVLEPISVGFHALNKVDFKLNKAQRILILGAGFIGLVIAKHLASKAPVKGNIFIVDRNQSKLTIAQKFGIQTINSARKRWSSELLNKFGGFEYVIEVCGDVSTYRQSITLAKSHGTVLWVGNIAGDLKFEKKEISSILRKELTIIGSWNSKFTHRNDHDWNAALSFIKSAGNLKELISHEVSLEEAIPLFSKLYRRKTNLPKKRKETFLKAVIDLSR